MKAQLIYLPLSLRSMWLFRQYFLIFIYIKLCICTHLDLSIWCFFLRIQIFFFWPCNFSFAMYKNCKVFIVMKFLLPCWTYWVLNLMLNEDIIQMNSVGLRPLEIKSYPSKITIFSCGAAYWIRWIKHSRALVWTCLKQIYLCRLICASEWLGELQQPLCLVLRYIHWAQLSIRYWFSLLCFHFIMKLNHNYWTSYISEVCVPISTFRLEPKYCILNTLWYKGN